MTRVGLLVAGHVDPTSVHVAGDYPQLFDALLAPFGIDIVPYDLEAGQFPATLRECDGWMCSPSRLSTYDDVPWLGDAEDLHREIIEGEHPYVGICFGHQLLAQALGGKVARAANGWGVGVQQYDVVEELSCMDPPLAQFSLLASHQDQVVEVPDDARVIATSVDGHCPVAGLAVGDRAWTLQGHPEFVPSLADHLLAGRVAVIGADRVDRARGTLARPLDRHTIGRWIANFFARDPG
jgi:GMP synthase-like glutamine amidotransferase